MKKVILFTALLFIIAISKAQNVDSAKIYLLIQNVSENPKQKDIDSLLVHLNNTQYLNYRDTIFNFLRSVVKDSTKQNYILIGLSRINCPEFDLDLANLINEQFRTKMDLSPALLNSIKLSGGMISYDYLVKICLRPLLELSNTKINAKIKLWKLLFLKDKIKTTLQALEYYTYFFMGGKEIDQSQAVTTMLISFTNEVSGNKLIQVDLLRSFKNFVLVIDSNFSHMGRVFDASDSAMPNQQTYRFPSIFLGQNGSPRKKMNLHIFNILKTLNTPYAQSVLIEFTRCDDAQIRQQAKDWRYEKLSNISYFPKDFNPTYDSIINRRIFETNRSIQPDYRNIYLFAANYMNMLNYRFFINNRLGPVMAPIMVDTSITTVNREKVLNKYKSAISTTILSLKERFKIEQLEYADTIENFLQTVQFIPQYVTNFFDFQTLNKYLTDALSLALQKEGTRKETSDSTALLIVGKEFDRQALGAYGLACLQKNLNIRIKSVDFSNLDGWLDSFLIRRKPKPAELQTQVVRTLIPQQNSVSQFNNKVIQGYKVLVRKFSFSDGLYYEKIVLKDENNIGRTINWYGTIPISLIVPLMRHPRLLDYTDYSLAFTEFTRLARKTDEFKTELDAIRIDPINALGYLLYHFENDKSEWKDVMESIALNPFNYYKSNEFKEYLTRNFDSTSKMRPTSQIQTKPWYNQLSKELQIMGQLGYPGGVNGFWGTTICVDSADFNSKRNDYLQPLLYLMSYKAYRRLNELLVHYNTHEVSETQPCHDFDFLCHLDIVTNENQERTKAIENGQAAIIKLLISEDYLNAWDLTNFVIDKDSKVYNRQLFLTPDFKRFFGTYEIVSGNISKFVNLEGELQGIPPELLLLLQKDRNFLNKYNLDLSGASTDAVKRIENAVYRSFNEDYGVNSYNSILKETGYATIKPWALGHTPKKPLFKSEEGKILATELSYVNQILNFGLGGPLQSDFKCSPAFIQSVKAFWDKSISYIESQASANAGSIISQTRNHGDDFSIFIGISSSNNGGGSRIILEISHKSFSLSLNSSPDLKDVGVGIGSNNIKFTPVSFNLSNLFKKPQEPSSFTPPVSVTNQLNPVKIRLNINDIPTLMAMNSIVNVRRINRNTQGSDMSNPSSLMFATIGEFTATISSNWMSISPIIGPGPWANSAEANGNRQWLQGLIFQARTSFTDEEIRQLYLAANSGFFPEPLVDVLIKKRNEAIEEQNIKNGQWIKTVIPEAGLIPDEINRNHLSVEEYIKEFNKGNDDEFQKQLNAKQIACEALAVFEDGMPGLELAYSKDFQYMMWTYRYKCVDGTILEKSHINDVYVGLIPLLRANPNGHVLEKMTSLASETFINYSNLTNPVRRAELKKFEASEHLRESFTRLFEETATNLKDYLEPKLKEYLDSFKKWLDENDGNKEGVEKPFEPGPYGTPALNLFPSPWEWQQRKNEQIESILTIQRNGQLNQGLGNGTIEIRPRLP